MKRINKHLLTIMLCVLAGGAARSQSITVTDLTKLLNASHQEVAQYLTGGKGFKQVYSNSLNGKTITQYRKGREEVTKTEWKKLDKYSYPTVHYDVQPKTYAETLTKELLQQGFKLSSKDDDRLKHSRVYQSNKYIVSIYTFEDAKLPVSVDIRPKN